jgi:hypothetical protein
MLTRDPLQWGGADKRPTSHEAVETRSPTHMRPLWKWTHSHDRDNKGPTFMKPCWKHTHFTKSQWQESNLIRGRGDWGHSAHARVDKGPTSWTFLYKFSRFPSDLQVPLLTEELADLFPNICLPTISVHVYILFEILLLKRHNLKLQLVFGLRIQEVPCSDIVIRSTWQPFLNFRNPSGKMAGNTLQMQRIRLYVPKFIIR